jgi:hypothetical protein
MSDIEKQDAKEVERLVAEAEADFASRPWWSSTGGANQARNDASWRSVTQQVLGTIRSEASSLTPAAAARMIARLGDPVYEKVIVGQSVGFKKPRGFDIRWVEAPGVVDPLEASRLAVNSKVGIRILSEGYLEYGVSPMISWRKVESNKTATVRNDVGEDDCFSPSP